MVTVSVNVDPPFTVSALTLDNGDAFFVIRCGAEASIILPGLNADAVAQARSLASALDSAAAALGEVLASAEGPSFNADAHISIDEPIPPRGSYAD